MNLLAKKPLSDTVFGAPYAVLNLSKVGLRYFRFMIKASPDSRARLVSHFLNHPNVGWIFSADGWFNLAVGVWAKDNAEINDVNNSLREVLNKNDEIVYESELTSLYGFGNRPVKGGDEAMPIIDSVFAPISLSSLEVDYIKLLTLDSSLPNGEMAEILGVDEKKLFELRSGLESSGVIVGYQERLNYKGVYYKVFIDTLSAKNSDALKALTDRLWKDKKCIYIERANGKYNFEFELILEKKSDIKEYLKNFSDHRTAILNENLYTNLYPLNKIANLKEIKDTIMNQPGKIIDFRNSKLWYLNHKGADSYLGIYQNKKYFEAMNKSELDLFDEVAKYIKKESPSKKYSVIDIGSGDGFKGRTFIERLGEDTVKAYYPVDVQPIELAAALKAHEQGPYARSPVLLDFKNLSARFPLKIHPDEVQIYLFLGGTYGNFKNNVINSYLKILVADPSTTVLISMPIRSGVKTDEEIMSIYAGKKMEDMAFGPLLQLGFSIDEFESNEKIKDLRLHLTMEDRCVVSSFILARDRKMFDRKFEKGTVFKMTRSWKPNLGQVENALSEDFRIKHVFSNEEMSVVAVSARV